MLSFAAIDTNHHSKWHRNCRRSAGVGYFHVHSGIVSRGWGVCVASRNINKYCDTTPIRRVCGGLQSSKREVQPVAAADDRWPGASDGQLAKACCLHQAFSSISGRSPWPCVGMTNLDGGSPRARERRRVQNLEQTSGRLQFVRSRLGDLLHLASFQVHCWRNYHTSSN